MSHVNNVDRVESVNENSDQLDETKLTHLKAIYYNASHKAGFSALDKLYKFVRDEGLYNYKKKEVKDFLLHQDVYTGHVVKRKAKRFYNVVVPRANDTIDMDTAHFNFDTAYKYFVVGIDIFTRKAAARALRDIKATSSKKAINEIIQELGGTKKLRIDRGVEFKNRNVLKSLKSQNIEPYFSFAPYKSNYAERLIRTLKRKLYLVMQSKGTKRWETILPDVIKSYNDSIHSSTGHAPNNVNDNDESDIWFHVKHKNFKKAPIPKKYKFELNDTVKINSIRENFAKEFYENNSIRHYFISHRSAPSGIQRYKLKDENNRSLPGSYSTNQLQPVKINENTRYRIEKILHRKRIRNIPHAFIKWFGYPQEFNTYIPVSEIERLQ